MSETHSTENSVIDNIPGPLLAVLAIVCYVVDGGRFTIAFAFAVAYMIFKVESLKSQSKNASKSCCNGGGSNGGSCCSSKQNNDDKKSLLSEKIAKKKGSCCGGGHCKTKKVEQPEISETATKSVEEPTPVFNKESTAFDEYAVDFTNAFKKPTSKAKSDTPKSVPLTAAKKTHRVITSNKPPISKALTVSKEELLNAQIYIFFSTLQGASERAAMSVAGRLEFLYPNELKKKPIQIHIDEIDDIEDYFVTVPENAIYILVAPSYDSDSPLDVTIQALDEISNDFRIDKFPLRKLVGFSVLGLGDSETWPEKFCYQGKQLDLLLAKLGGRRIYPLGQYCTKHDAWGKIEEWADLLGETLKDDQPILYQYDEAEDDNDDQEPVVDLEDIGKSEELDTMTKKMVAKDSPTYKNLTKQGYVIVGSHSGVKICRWTKNDLRGRGSCYKQSLFNIVSSRCMELTPSLACSSKCVFCWRHGTNPVSKNWRWEVDEPEYILEEGLKGHYSKIKQLRGVPGVIAERFQKAFEVRHCALSLVGEPIMYPHINRFVDLLHGKNISSFLVCNAQHPQQLRDMKKVTQLYVSIDAPTKAELKKVDRPLYKDFWERMLECLEILKTVQSHQRTVFRMTLVKGFNMDLVSAYADLVAKGMPCFIEVKGATFCGSSDGNGNPLTMQNIPFYEECVKFVTALEAELNSRGLAYGIAAEHAHSNCILLASKKFYINEEWHTHIDFDKFFELLHSGKSFTHLDYIDKTPEWALFGNGGFAPNNTRFYRKNRKEVTPM